MTGAARVHARRPRVVGEPRHQADGGAAGGDAEFAVPEPVEQFPKGRRIVFRKIYGGVIHIGAGNFLQFERDPGDDMTETERRVAPKARYEGFIRLQLGQNFQQFGKNRLVQPRRRAIG